MRLKKYVVLLSIIMLGVSLLPVRAQATVEFPALTGDYPVGRTDYHLIDDSRDEIFTAATDDQRELMVTVYYPAAPATEAVPAPYAEGDLKTAMAELIGLESEIFDALQPHAFADAPVADGVFPVLIFSPGLSNPPLFYRSLLEELASHGYIIAAMSHPYSTGITFFSDGRVVLANEQGSLRAEPVEEESPDALLNRVVGVWAQDARFVLDQLTAMNIDDSMLTGKLNLEQVGMLGHSFGGAASGEALYLDSRIDAGINIDGTPWGTVLASGVRQPFMFLLSENLAVSEAMLEITGMTREAANAELAIYTERIDFLFQNASPGYRLHLIGSQHHTFTTDVLMMSLLMPGAFNPDLIGDIEPARALHVISTYVVAFFDKHVKGATVALLDGASADYPEVEFESSGN